MIRFLRGMLPGRARCALLPMLLAPVLCSSQVPKALKHEVRAVWVTTVLGLDWPKSTDRQEQQRSLREIVERLKQANFNTIFFQVRSRADAMYQSRYEPWCQQLTGTLGKDPGWDPLRFIIGEAHSRGMEVHAWINTFYARSGPRPPPSDPPHVILRHPEWLRQIDSEWWFNPGIPAARDYVVSVAMDIVTNYDVDGINFDYLRYPSKPFPDDDTYRRYGGGFTRDDWRRENVNRFARAFHSAAASVKPALKIGSSPIGIYVNTGKTKGLQAFSELFQDSREWLREGVQDYLAPQIYWSMGEKPGNPDFVALARDWISHESGKQIFVGVGAYKPDVMAQLPSLIDTSRALGADGISFFRYENISGSPDPGGRFARPAIIPPMPWKDPSRPNPPRQLELRYDRSSVKLHWHSPDPAADGDRARFYCVYRSATSSDPATLVAVGPDTEFTDASPRLGGSGYAYSVTSLDRGNNESLASVGSVASPEIAELAARLAPEDRLGKSFAASSVVFIPYEVKRQSPVSLTIVDESGRERLTIVSGVQPAGRYVAAANVKSLGEGTLWCVLTTGGSSLRTRLNY